MRICRISMVLTMAVVTMVTCLALPRQGRGQIEDPTAKQVPPSSQAKDSDQNQDQHPAQKKDAKAASDPARENHIRTPIQPPQDAAAAAKAETNSAKDLKVPFATGKRLDDEGQKTAHSPNAPNWKVKDLGDRVRFEFSTPVGPNVWIKKKSELNDTEKLALANATAAVTPAPAASGTPQK